MDVSLSQAQMLTSPNPFCLVGSLTKKGTTNLMAVSWWTYLSNRPASIAVCINAKAYTNQRIKETGEFSVCVADESLAKAAMQCGTTSGRTVDKAAVYGIELTPSLEIAPALVKKSRVAMECRTMQCVPLSDHDLFIAEVVALRTNASYRALFATKGYGELLPVSLRPD